MKRVSTHFFTTAIQIGENSKGVRIAIAKSNKDYDLVLTRLYLYYNMKLVTFGIETKGI